MRETRVTRERIAREKEIALKMKGVRARTSSYLHCFAVRIRNFRWHVVGVIDGIALQPRRRDGHSAGGTHARASAATVRVDPSLTTARRA